MLVREPQRTCRSTAADELFGTRTQDRFVVSILEPALGQMNAARRAVVPPHQAHATFGERQRRVQTVEQ